MGVSGSGKSTIGKLLANKLNLPFFDGDDFHPEANIKKMAQGDPLNDMDRKAWLKRLNRLAIDHRKTGAIIVCSALKEAYRISLSKNLANGYCFVFLNGSLKEINERLTKRTGHFMPKNLLQSQFDILEIPKNAINVSINDSPEKIVDRVILQLKTRKAP